MATQTPMRSSAASKTTKSAARAGEETKPFSSRIKAAGRGLRRSLPDISVPERLRREAAGIVTILAAALTAWMLWTGSEDGRLVHLWSRALHSLFGGGTFVIPILLALLAYRCFAAELTPVLTARHYVGGTLFQLSAVGLIALANGQGDNRAGGFSGKATASAVSSLLGSVGGGLLLFVVGTVAVFLLTGTDIKTFVADLRSLAPHRNHPRGVLDGNEHDFPKGIEAPVVSVTPVLVRRAIVAPPPPVPASPPLINRPKDGPPAEASETPTSIAPPTATLAAGKPLPRPDVAKLALYEGVVLDEGELTTKARRIESTLASFKVEARVREINPGPAVTQYTLEPGVGIKVRRITELQNDLALALAAPSIRIEAPVPGMARVGIEVPNAKVATVGLRETLESPSFARREFKLPIPLGRDVHGNYVIHDLTKMPHLLIAGATGSGKSVCLTAIISTFLLSRGPDQLKMLMIDPKMVELTGYNGVPHLQCPVVTEMDKVTGALRLVLLEMERRYTLFSKLGVRNLDGYRMKMADESGAEVVPYLVVVIDELADLMMTAPEDVESLLCRLAQMGRAAGIHLIIATQRPSVDVLTGLIKANVPARIAFAVTSLTDSRVVLDMPGAERLLGRGDMLFLPPDAAKPQRIQGAFVEDKDVQYIVNHWHEVTPIPQYAAEWLRLESNAADAEGDGEDDPLMAQAKEMVRSQGTASASMLQRKLRIGYNRAARLIEQMEDEGLIGPADGIKGRPFLGGDY